MGGQLLRFTGWRGLFWLLAGFGALLTCLVATCVRETLPAERRRRHIPAALRSYGDLLADRRVMSCASMTALGYIALMAYVAGSSFVYQHVHGVSTQSYGLLFGLNAVGLVAVHQLNARLVLSVQPLRIIRRTVPVTVAAAVLLIVTTSTEILGLVGLVVPLFVLISSLGLILPNSTAMALDVHPESAGATAALVGCLQFTAGALAAPAVGAGGPGTAVPMAVTTATAVLGVGIVAWRVAAPARRASRLAPTGSHDTGG